MDDDDLVEELAPVRRLVGLIGRLDWFNRIGLPFEAADEDNARAYLDYLGFPDAQLVPVIDYAEAVDSSDTLDINAPSWEAEEQLRAGLTADAAAYFEAEELETILQHVNSVTAESAGAALEAATLRLGPMPEDLAHSAIGGAVRAAHHAALLLLSEEDADHHAFAYQFKLFELGRWPLALNGNSFFLF